MTQDHLITDLRVHVIHIPAKAVHSHGSGDVSGINSVILEIITDSGITGWGEASPWPVFTGTAQANAAALHVHLRPHLIGADPLHVEKHLAMADRVVVQCSEAKAALEMALLDIVGQIAGLPVGDTCEGRSFLFDDTYKHEVHNRSDEERVVLLIHVRRPVRFPGSLVSRGFLGAIKRSPFIQDALQNQEEWLQGYNEAMRGRS